MRFIFIGEHPASQLAGHFYAYTAALPAFFSVLGHTLWTKIVKHCGLRDDGGIWTKFRYICGYAGRSANSQIIQLMLKFISDYEKEHGKIDLNEITK